MVSFLRTYRLHISLALLSAAILAFQLALMQILSIVQWYHFAYMVISVALLGFGAAGTFLALFRAKLISYSEELLPLLMMSTGIMMALVTGLSQVSFIRFDSYLLFAEYSHIGKLLLTYLLFFIPFFLGALAIGLVFIIYVDQIGKIYFANLLGSGAGGVLALMLVGWFFPRQLPALIALLPLVAGFMLLPQRRKMFYAGFGLITLLIISWKLIDPPQLVLSQYKDLRKTLLLPQAKLTMEKSSPHGLVQTVSSPVLRYAPGLSLSATQTAEVRMATFVNGDWFGAITGYNKNDTAIVLDYTTMALPYIMSKRNSVLVLRAGTGSEVAHALSKRAKMVKAVEPNESILTAMREKLATVSDSIFFHPAVSVHHLEPRTFLLMDTAHYDLIVPPIVGNFGGSSGLYALMEQFLFTKEAFRDMWHRLNNKGAISITSWMDYPFRNPLKVLATLVEVLNELGVKNPKEHIAAVRSWGTITFVITRSPIQLQEINNIRSFCDQMMFDPALLPQLKPDERAFYNQFQDDRFFTYIDQLTSPQRNRFYSEYDFNIRPATDNMPYFSQFLKWQNLDRISGFFGNRSLPFFEIGYLLVLITLLQISAISFALILLPLFRLGWKGKLKFRVLLYFAGIGLGYMFVEMIFIQRFILYFGNPVYAASAVIIFLLIFSGIGSYISGYFMKNRKWLLGVLSAIVVLLLLYSFLLTPLLQRTIDLSLPLKLGIVFLLIAPLAFFMGVPFPAGLSQVSKTNKEIIPWAWGINGCVSVISTALATLVAVEMGFTWVMLLAALAYCLPLLVQLKWKE